MLSRPRCEHYRPCLLTALLDDLCCSRILRSAPSTLYVVTRVPCIARYAGSGCRPLSGGQEEAPQRGHNLHQAAGRRTARGEDLVPKLPLSVASAEFWQVLSANLVTLQNNVKAPPELANFPELQINTIDAQRPVQVRTVATLSRLSPYQSQLDPDGTSG